jgi:hypothetical protein
MEETVPVCVRDGILLVDRPSRFDAAVNAANEADINRSAHNRQRPSLAPVDADDHEAARRFFRRNHMVLVRCGGTDATAKGQLPDMCALATLQHAAPHLFSAAFRVENDSRGVGGAPLSPEAVFRGTAGSYYVSCILSSDERDRRALNELLHLLPFGASPPFLKGAVHDGGAWLFAGRHPVAPSDTLPASTGVSIPPPPPLQGRPEHVDNVATDGTWHMQCSGTKTWHLRPKTDAPEWEGRDPPDLPCGRGGGTAGCVRPWGPARVQHPHLVAPHGD